jgi:hypothetical protein
MFAPFLNLPPQVSQHNEPNFLVGILLTSNRMTLEELEREYVTLRQQADAVRSYL